MAKVSSHPTARPTQVTSIESGDTVLILPQSTTGWELCRGMRKALMMSWILSNS